MLFQKIGGIWFMRTWSGSYVEQGRWMLAVQGWLRFAFSKLAGHS